MILNDISEAVGNTPLLRLSRFAPDADCEILAKLELLNPYSVKDRPVLFMLREAARRGDLKPGGMVVEATSGNTGMAVAMLCSVLGYRCTLVMSEIQSLERRAVLRGLGADLVLTPRAEGTKAAKREAMRIAEETGALYLGQHDNPANPAAHEATTAEELWRDTEGRIDGLVAGLGTGGTLVGVARGIKPKKPTFRTIGVEPDNAAFISRGEFSPHRIMGTAPGFVPGVLQRDLIDEIELISEAEAFQTCREIARTEGLLVGISAGAAAAVARRLAARPEWRGKCLVCVFADTGQRYLSVEGLFTGDAE